MTQAGRDRPVITLFGGRSTPKLLNAVCGTSGRVRPAQYFRGPPSPGDLLLIVKFKFRSRGRGKEGHPGFPPLQPFGGLEKFSLGSGGLCGHVRYLFCGGIMERKKERGKRSRKRKMEIKERIK